MHLLVLFLQILRSVQKHVEEQGVLEGVVEAARWTRIVWVVVWPARNTRSPVWRRFTSTQRPAASATRSQLLVCTRQQKHKQKELLNVFFTNIGGKTSQFFCCVCYFSVRFRKRLTYAFPRGLSFPDPLPRHSDSRARWSHTLTRTLTAGPEAPQLCPADTWRPG